MTEDRSETRQRRVTVAEAAEVLGLTVEAVRGRIKRGKLEHAKEDGKVYVLLDTDQSADRLSAKSELIEALREQVAYVREQLAEEREARRRADTIIAQLAQANAEQARTIRALEAPSEPSEQREPPQTDAEDAGGVVEPRPAPGEAQEGAQPRSWWRRWLGFE